jgi:hypothetical protein
LEDRLPEGKPRLHCGDQNQTSAASSMKQDLIPQMKKQSSGHVVNIFGDVRSLSVQQGRKAAFFIYHGYLLTGKVPLLVSVRPSGFRHLKKVNISGEHIKDFAIRVTVERHTFSRIKLLLVN